MLQWRVREISLTDLKQTAEQYVAANERAPDVLNRTALRLVETSEPELLAMAEAFAVESLTGRDGFIDLVTCCTVFLANDKWLRVLEFLPRIFEAIPDNSEAIGIAIDFAVQVASAGYANEVLETLVSSSTRSALEPLEVGLKYFLGKPPSAPKEISEVGQDIANKIRSIASARRGLHAANEGGGQEVTSNVDSIGPD